MRRALTTSGKVISRLNFSATVITLSSPRPPLKLLPVGNTRIESFLDPHENLFYVDKAAFIPLVEKTARVTVFLRPKRWGKSTFLNLLLTYYDSAHAAAPIVHVPGGDTPFAHSFTVLKFDLANVARAVSSQVASADAQAQIIAALDAEVRFAVAEAVDRYCFKEFDMTQPPSELLRKLGRIAAACGAPLYVFVDEYDALLRSFIISSGTHSPSTLAGRHGPIREFFGRLKYLLDGGHVRRIFLTGISSVGLEAMSASFNVAMDLSQEPAFNAAVGFTRADVLCSINECLGYEERSAASDAIMATLTRWSDGYLFAPELAVEQGMFQSVMVVQLLSSVLLRTENSLVSLIRFLERWAPSGAIAPKPDPELMDFYAPSAAMSTLLPKLSLGRPLEVPEPLAALSVRQQVLAAAPFSTATEISHTTALKALAAVPLETSAAGGATTISLTEAESTVVRTLYYEGLLTHIAGPCRGLRVPNDFIQHHFVDKFAAHLASDTTLCKAAEDFILRGRCAALEAALSSVCEPGLIWQGVFKWYEFDCSQRLRLLLTTALQSTRFRWELEEIALRIRAGRDDLPGRTDVSGRHASGTHFIHIEVKQVHIVWDMEAFTEKLGQPFNQRNREHQNALLSFAKGLRKLTTKELLALKIKESSIKRVSTAGVVLEDAKEQAREYARGWTKKQANDAAIGMGVVLPQLDVYAAVSFGPLRWVVVRVPLDEDSAGER